MGCILPEVLNIKETNISPTTIVESSNIPQGSKLYSDISE